MCSDGGMTVDPLLQSARETPITNNTTTTRPLLLHPFSSSPRAGERGRASGRGRALSVVLKSSVTHKSVRY